MHTKDAHWTQIYLGRNSTSGRLRSQLFLVRKSICCPCTSVMPSGNNLGSVTQSPGATGITLIAAEGKGPEPPTKPLAAMGGALEAVGANEQLWAMPFASDVETAVETFTVSTLNALSGRGASAMVSVCRHVDDEACASWRNDSGEALCLAKCPTKVVF